FDVRRQRRRVGRADAEDVGEIISLEVVITLIMEVAEPALGEIDRDGGDGRFLMFAFVGGAGGVGQKERIKLAENRPAQRDLLINVRGQGTPNGEFLDVQAIEAIEIGEAKLEKGPLVAFEIDRQGEGQGGDRFEAEAVEKLNKDIDVTIRLGPNAVLAMNW